MPFVTNRDKEIYKKSLRRPLIVGRPYSGKTTSLKTFPGPRHLLIAPGELGHTSILDDELTKVYVWQEEEGKSWGDKWNAIKALTAEIVSGKHGEVVTFAIDGLHVLMYIVMKSLGWTPLTEGKAYPRYYTAFEDYLKPLVNSDIPYFVCTIYDGKESTEGVETGVKKVQVSPELPGKEAQNIMGVFPVCFYAEREPAVIPGNPAKFNWIIKPTDRLQAAGLHIPKELAEKFPSEVPQDWNEIEKRIAEL